VPEVRDHLADQAPVLLDHLVLEGGADQFALGDAGPLRGVEEALEVVAE